MGPNDPHSSVTASTQRVSEALHDVTQSAATPETAGARVGCYPIKDEIARSKLAEVWRSHDPAQNRPLAVKVLRANFKGQPEIERRFLEEARLIGKLQHPGIPAIHEVGTLPDGRPFFTLRLIDGRTLEQMLRERPSTTTDLPRFLGIFEQACQALACAHSCGIIHGDLSPANIIVGSQGEVQVMDWSCARPASRSCPAPEKPASSPVSEESEAIAYLAPEQARGEDDLVDERSDVFRLGAVLCAILTGHPPFRAARPEKVLALAARGELIEARGRLVSSGADSDLVQITWQCLAAQKANRPANAGEVLTALRAHVNRGRERSVEAEPQQATSEGRGGARTPSNPVWRRRLLQGLAALAVLVLLGVAAGGGWLLYQSREKAQEQQREVEQETLVALERAREFLDAGWQANDPDKLRDARSEAIKAQELAQGGASAAVQEQVADVQAQIDDRLGRMEKNRLLFDALLSSWGPPEAERLPGYDRNGILPLPPPGADEQCAAAFWRWGKLNIDGRADWEVVARLREEPKAIQPMLIACLDRWVLARRWQKRPEEQWRRLLRLIEQLDPDEQRQQLRTLLVERMPSRVESVAGLLGADRPWLALWSLARGDHWLRVKEVGAKIDPATASPLTVLLLAEAHAAMGDLASAEQVVRKAVDAQRLEVVLLLELGLLLERQGPARLDDAIRWYSAKPGMTAARLRAQLKAGRGMGGDGLGRQYHQQPPDNPALRFYVIAALGTSRDAEVVCRKVVESDPADADAFALLGNVLYKTRQLDEAVKAYRKAVERRPDFALAYYNLGRTLDEQNKLGEAVPAYRKAAQLAPNLALASYRLGLALLKQGKFDEAVKVYDRCREDKSDFLGAFRVSARTLVDQLRWGEAASAYSSLITLDQDSNLCVQLGTLLCKEGNLAAAEDAYRLAVVRGSTVAPTYRVLAGILVGRNKPVEAAAAYRRVIELAPKDAEAYRALGDLLARLRRPAEAEAAYRKTLELRPDDAQAFCELGRVLDEQNRLDDAVATLRQAIQLAPALAPAHANLGNILAKQRKPAEAVIACQEALALNPRHARAWTVLGIALRAQSKSDDAENAFRRAIDLAPTDAEAYTNLGNALRAERKLAGAVAAYRLAIQFAPDDAGTYNNLGTALDDQRKLEEAEAAYARAIELQPDLAEAHLNLGIALLQQARFKESVAALNRGADLLPARDARRQQVQRLVKQCERQQALDARLPAVLAGSDKPAGAEEQIEFGRLCARKQLYTASAHFYRDGFTAEPRRAEPASSGVRYNAACAAARAGCGLGKDAGKLDDQERATWRQQAHDWLRADLTAWGNVRNKLTAARQMRYWQEDDALAGVRDAAALGNLPEKEHQDWQKLWADVAALQRRAATAP
jgi:tetratricopeptide (TPR) repeat protein